jgi:tyrosinase
MSNGIVVRPSTEHADVPALADGYDKMQSISGSDNRSWIFWAEYHGFNRFECWHHARQGNDQFPYDLFLPWHRAYLMFWDNAARDQNAGAILPWWDWTSDLSHQVGIPQAFTQGNPSLESGPVPVIGGQGPRRTSRNPSDPADLPTPADVDAVLALTDFRDFSNQLQDIHDGVHGWAGGDMGSIGTSAFDPIFWSHHAMIDRIWYLWQLRHGVNNIPSNYLDKALFPGYTVQQVLDVRSLGYDYASAAVAAGTDVPVGVAPPAEGAAAGGEPAGGGAGGAPEETKPPVPGKKYDSDTLYVGTLDPDPYRADIEFYGVDHEGASYEGRVYLNNPDADENTGYSEEAGYAGSYHIFGHGGCLGDPGHCDVEPRREYDPRPEHPLSRAKKVVVATDAVKRVIGQDDEVTVTVVPIVEPLPYEDVEPRYVEEPVDIEYVRLVTYR